MGRAPRGVLTDVSGRDPEGLDHQNLLPRLRDAIQDPALGREFGKVFNYFYFFRFFRINKNI